VKTIHLVSHTHWDREWYQTFQQFRFRLVRLVDELLDMLDGSDFDFFTLDGQTIVLDDYLEIRPEQEGRICRLVQAGKLMIGPWYVLPDEFLEGPEAMVRNLLVGRRGCRRFSDDEQPMERVCYIPDTFGHVSQLPQIAAGFGQEAVCLWRGVGDAQTELRWAAADGTERLLLHLRDSYSNGALLPPDEAGFVRTLTAQIDSLAPYTPTSNLLLMVGTDHMAPHADLPGHLPAAEAALGCRPVQSTLPAYLSAVQAELGAEGLAALTLRQGELRSPQRAHLLPAVLSARIWIKQWNAQCETLLTRWAEPFGAVAEQLDGDRGRRGFLRTAWTWLLQNHPHDSICGCSVDQVHQEMRTRFAWSEQIAEQVTQASLRAIAGQVNTTPALATFALPSIVVFNPTAGLRSGRIRVSVEPAPEVDCVLVDEAGQAVDCRVRAASVREQYSQTMDRDTLTAMLSLLAVSGGQVGADLFPRRIDISTRGSVACVEVLARRGATAVTGANAADPDLLTKAMADLQALLADPVIHSFQIRILELTSLEFELLARDVPGFGYKTYRLAPGHKLDGLEILGLADYSIENEYFRIEADPDSGTVTVTDKDTGLVLPGLNRFVDGGDRGDEYTFTPPEHDLIVNGPDSRPVISPWQNSLGAELKIEHVYRLPQALGAQDRSRRSDRWVEVPITTRVSLTPGVRRVEFETTVDNRAKDHRLRVHFPTPIITDRSWAGSHFDVVERPIALPTGTAGWAEQPTGCHPQLGFVDLCDGQRGLMLLNRGLPEYEALAGQGQGVTLALTLLRCVGWLSRGDLHNRPAHAGPAEPTPEAQCPGEHTFHYALVPHSGNYLTSIHEAAAFAAPLRAVSTSAHEGPLPPQSSFVDVSPAAVVISAIKPPEEGNGLIVRLYNAASLPVQARLKLWRPFREAALVPLAEGAPLQVLVTDADTVTLPLRGKEIATLQFR
jgi:alpha-mannosidase